MDMPAVYFEEESLSSKVLQSLEAIGIDAEPLRIKYGKPTSKRVRMEVIAYFRAF
jgi:hypothetical protein